MVKARLSSVLSKITVPYQLLPAFDGTGIAIGYYEKVIGYRRKGFVVMVGDDDAMVLAPLPYKSLDLVDIHKNLWRPDVQGQREIASQVLEFLTIEHP